MGCEGKKMAEGVGLRVWQLGRQVKIEPLMMAN